MQDEVPAHDAVSYPEFTIALRAQRPRVLHFVIQRREKPLAHQLHLCLEDGGHGVTWLTMPFVSTKNGLERVLRFTPV